MTRMQEAFEWSWARRGEVMSMTEMERAAVRACLDQAKEALIEAGEIQAWWGKLSVGNRDQCRGFIALLAVLSRDLNR